MANEKILNTRIQLKYDSYANWTTNNPVLKQGEVAVATIDTNSDGVQNAPSVVVKVGDGVNAYKALNFISGLAADVYSWAKAATKPDYTADEISGLSEYIASEIEDTDTQYQLVKVDDYNYKLQSKTLDGSWVDVADSTIVIPKYDDTAVKADIAANASAISAIKDGTTIDSFADVESAVAGVEDDLGDVSDRVTIIEGDYLKAADKTELNGLITAAQEDVDTLAAKVGTVPTDKTVVQMIADAQAAATYDDTEVRGLISDNADDIAALDDRLSTLVGSDSGKSARTIANEELAAQLIPENAAEALNTLEEIAAWIQAHPDDASAMNAAIAALQNQLSGIDAGTGTVKKYVDDAITALNVGQYALAADLTALAARVSTLEGEMETAQADIVANTEAIDALDDSLAAIAKTGNVNDLVQTSGDVLVFDCGTSVI